MYKETVPFVNGGSYFHFTKKRFLFVCLKYIFAQSSGEDETIPSIEGGHLADETIGLPNKFFFLYNVGMDGSHRGNLSK